MAHWHNQVFSLLEVKRYFCFGGGGGGDKQQMPAQPASSPVPVSSPSPQESASYSATRRRQLAAMRYGMQSTIKTSPQGIDKSWLSTDDSKKKTLGS